VASKTHIAHKGNSILLQLLNPPKVNMLALRFVEFDPNTTLQR